MRDDIREISTSEYVTLCLSYPRRREMQIETPGILPTPTGSNFAYLNDGIIPKIGRKGYRKNKNINKEFVNVGINDEGEESNLFNFGSDRGSSAKNSNYNAAEALIE